MLFYPSNFHRLNGIYTAALWLSLTFPGQPIGKRQEISPIFAQSPVGQPSILNEENQLNSHSQEELEKLLKSATEFYDQHQYQEALNFYQKILVIYQEMGNQAGNAATLYSLGLVYEKLAEYDQAIDSYQQALVIYQEIGIPESQGKILNNLGAIYQQQGFYEKALEFYQKSLVIRQAIQDQIGEGRTLNNIGSIYDSQGFYAKALEFYQQALAIFQNLNQKMGIAALLSNIGLVYSELGEYDQALNFYQQSLILRQEISDQAGIGRTLHNIGFTYNQQHQYLKALEFYQKALRVRQTIADQEGEAATLNNMGYVQAKLGQSSQALQLLQQALKISQEMSNRAGEGRTLDSMGTVYQDLGQFSQALELYQQSLGLQKQVGDRDGERITLGNIGSVLEEQNQPELAIIFYKQSVNVTEAIRKELRNLPQTQQESYTQTVAENYRSLADLLLRQNRVEEAQKVLDLLKIQELNDYLNHVSGNQQTAAGIELLPEEAQLLKNYQEFQQFNQFIQSPGVREQVRQLNQITGGQNLNLQQFHVLQNQLRQIQKNAVLLYPLVLPDRLELVLVSPDSPPIHRTVAIKQADLNTAVRDFRIALTTPRYRYNTTILETQGNQLYKWLIQPLESDLRKVNAKTIIYAPDGALRYIPLAALHDGRQWLIQRFRIHNITAASLTHFTAQPQPLHILAAAFSQGSYKVPMGTREVIFAGLPYAAQEVEDIAAILPNTIKLLDQSFSPNILIPQMNQYSIIHLATHAQFVLGQPENSFILLGDGSRITLPEMAQWQLPNVDLVVLSACQTALGGQLGDGKEILGLGYQIQQTGAKAAMASLWSVDDNGTQVLMNAFYKALKTGNMTKAEALQQAQISLITGKSQPNLKYPYYWAAFILIGNGL